MASRDMTDLELVVAGELLDGKLDALAKLLALEGDVHPIVQRYLQRLICGSSSQTDFRLRVDRHPELKSPKSGARAMMLSSTKRLQTALVMARHGGLNKGQFEAALTATIDETGLDRATVCRHWADQKRFVRFCIARGIIDNQGSGRTE